MALKERDEVAVRNSPKSIGFRSQAGLMVSVASQDVNFSKVISLPMDPNGPATENQEPRQGTKRDQFVRKISSDVLKHIETQMIESCKEYMALSGNRVDERIYLKARSLMVRAYGIQSSHDQIEFGHTITPEGAFHLVVMDRIRPKTIQFEFDGEFLEVIIIEDGRAKMLDAEDREQFAFEWFQK